MHNRAVLPMRFHFQTKRSTGFHTGQGSGGMKTATIKGMVTEIIDGNTFDIKIESHPSTPPHVRRVKIDGLDKPAVSTLPGILAKLELEKLLIGRTLECEIVDRDGDNHVRVRIPKQFFKSPFSFKPEI